MEKSALSFHNLYDYFATIIPGVLVAGAIFVLFGEDLYGALPNVGTAFQVLVVLIGVFLLGHVLHPIGNMIEYAFLRLGGLRQRGPGHKALSSNLLLEQGVRDEIAKRLDNEYGLAASCDDAFNMCYAHLRSHGSDPLPARLRALRAFYRQITAGGIVCVGLAGYCVISTECMPGVLILAFSLALTSLSLYRYKRFYWSFHEAVLLAYLASPPRTACSKPVSKNLKALAGKVIALDFDGVVAQFNGWKGEGITGDPMPGLKEFLELMVAEGWTPVVYTARSIPTVQKWMSDHAVGRFFRTPDMPPGEYLVSELKPHAKVYVDDRGVTFDGNFERLARLIREFKPHWKP